jgi:periplasmic protein CpxP/Spy
MKHRTKIVILTFAISSLLTGRNVLAEPLDVAVLGKPKPVNEQTKKCDRWEGEEKRLETLKSDLKLKQDQEAAWTEWAGKIKGDHAGWEEKHKNEQLWASLPVPDRMEKMLAFSKGHIARQEVHLAATKTFYATLTPEQRLIFDKDFNFKHHGHFGNGVKQ